MASLDAEYSIMLSNLLSINQVHGHHGGKLFKLLDKTTHPDLELLTKPFATSMLITLLVSLLAVAFAPLPTRFCKYEVEILIKRLS